MFKVDPNTVLTWLTEVADHLAAFYRFLLRDVQVSQVQPDELFAALSAIKTSQMTEAEAIERLECSPHWVWATIDPQSKLLLAINVGERTLAMAQRQVHQVVEVLALRCVPLFLTTGSRIIARRC